ncbi:hypothetical protein V1517DRAFT_328069 [Lipomyces orientalis]|uniref:Uncharacterized protein n=1 Tax=Lipomyces orientalis TaxID=1233043 RepID=A0ACC3TL91_9ASCO
MSSGHISKSDGSRSRRIRACNHCRQFKIRCDSTELFPSPCSACKGKGKDCNVDATFKPIRTRSLLKDVTTRLTLIQDTLRHHDITIPHPSSVEGSHPLRDIIERPRLESAPAAPIPIPSAGSEDDTSFVGSQQLGEITLEADTIRDLFEHFRRNHFLYFPILNADFSAKDLAQSCPLLFWTIIIISSRYHTHHRSIYRSLFDPFLEILSIALVHSIRSVRDIQALLYVCMWPLRISKQHGDPSLTYCAVAVNASLMLGLHRPVLENENRNRGHAFPGDSEERMRTWRGCLYLSTHLNIIQGLPIQLPIRLYLDTINAIITSDDRSELSALVLIHCHMANMVSGLEGSFDPLACSTLITLFERELESIKTTFRQVWTTELEISLLAAKLCLYDLSLCHIGRLSSSTQPARHLKPGELVILTYGLTAASRLIDIFNKPALDDSAVNDMASFRLQICYPKRFFILMVHASLFMFRILGMPSQLEKSDINMARRKVQIAINVHRRSIRDPGDEHDRLAALIEILSRIEPSFYMEHFRSEYSRSLISECKRISSERTFGNFTHVESYGDGSGPAGVPREPLPTQSQIFGDPSALSQSCAEPSTLSHADQISQSLLTTSDFDSGELPWGVWGNVIFDSLML